MNNWGTCKILGSYVGTAAVLHRKEQTRSISKIIQRQNGFPEPHLDTRSTSAAQSQRMKLCCSRENRHGKRKWCTFSGGMHSMHHVKEQNTATVFLFPLKDAYSPSNTSRAWNYRAPSAEDSFLRNQAIQTFESCSVALFCFASMLDLTV